MFFIKTAIFSFYSLEANPLISGPKELSNALLRGTVPLLVPELCASVSTNVEIGEI